MQVATNRLHVLLALAFSATHVYAQDALDLKNWFNDPFFEITSDIKACPTPLGPLLTEEQRRTQAHSRAEKGATCWLAGRCDRPNYYAYDEAIAAAFKSQAGSNLALFKQTSVWVTVQARVVFIEGCVPKKSVASDIEAFARSLPHVQQAIALVRTSPRNVVPYKVKPKM